MSHSTAAMPKQTVIMGDCLSVLQDHFGSETVDVIVTSPPYNIGTFYNSYQDKEPREDYLIWLFKVWRLIKSVLKPDGSFFLNVGGTTSDPLFPIQVAENISELFYIQNRIAWVKSISIDRDPCRGHVKPVNSRRFLNQSWEEVLHLTKNGSVPVDRLALGVPFRDKTNLSRGSRGKNGDIRCQGNVWFIPYDTIQDRQSKGDHPAVFPVELARRCIRLHGLRDDLVVLDPFLGSGSTLIACKQLGVTGYGIEIDKKYADFARKRCGDYIEWHETKA